MQRRGRPAAPAFDAIEIEGALIASAMLMKIAAYQADGQTDASYHVPKGLTLRDEIARYFRIGQAQFRDFAKLGSPSTAATTVFVETLLRDVFGFADFGPAASREHGGRTLAVTSRGLSGRAPIVVTKPMNDLDHAAPELAVEGRRRSPALALQDWLNASDEALWGLCCNGERLRLMRANVSLTRPAYIEADLKQIFEADGFADFAALWLLVHASRFGAPGAPTTDSALERWRETASKEGLAARDRLRDGVEAALIALGNGFLSENPELRERDSLHQRAIWQTRGIKIAREFGHEQAAETRQPEPFLAPREREEDDLQATPFVDMPIPGGATDRLRSQGGERISLGVEPTRGRGRVGRMQQLAFLLAVLGDAEKDQAVDQPQQLAEEVAEREFALRNAQKRTPPRRGVLPLQIRRRAFVRTPAEDGGRFPLTGRGDVNTYALFAELFSKLTGPRGRAGVIVPTGIATDATTAPFFASLIEGRALASLIDFENRERIFPAIDSRIKFCLLTLARDVHEARFSFFLTDAAQLAEPERRFALSPRQIAVINPNTKSAPIFRSRADAELTAKIYARVPVLIDEAPGRDGNPWRFSYATKLFDMADDSVMFRTASQLRAAGFERDGVDWVACGLSPRPKALDLAGGRDASTLDLQGGSVGTDERYVPLYEAKMIHQFDHRWATYDATGETTGDATLAERADPNFESTPRYWVPEIEVEDRLSPLPKEFLSALRTRNFDQVALLVAQFLFALWLARRGYPERPPETWKIFDEWKAFVSRHPGLRGLAPTRIGLVGDNPALMRPTNANCLPAASVDAIVDTVRTKTAWYETDIKAVRTLTRSAGERSWMKEPEGALAGESTVFAFGEWMRTASCPKWLTGWRDITNATNERTVIATVFPRAGVGHTLRLMWVRQSPCHAGAFLSLSAALVLDYVAKQKVAGTHLTVEMWRQLPVLPPTSFNNADLSFITPRVLELTYTSHSLAPFARDLGYDGPPFAWNEDRRALLRAELDAFYARAYGLTRDELRYILDPADVRGPNYPSETFRVLKTNEKARFGEFRTARLVLDAWDRMERGELK